MKRLLWISAFCILAGSSAVWMFQRASGSDPRSLAQAADAARASRLPDPAPGTVALSPGTAERMGLELTALKPARQAPQVQTTALVLSPQGLAQLSTAYVADTAKLAVARTNLSISRNEYERQNRLYREDQTTSLKALQAARGALESSQAEIIAARRQLDLDSLSVEQQWGPVLRQWVVARSSPFEEILSQREWLVQVTVNGSDVRLMPKTARLIVPSGEAVIGNFLSSFPQTNPVIQGLNFLYVIPARAGFAPGLTLVAELPVGAAQRGVVIPGEAVVWVDGQAWAYKEIASHHFRRSVVATDAPVGNGWFVTAGFAPGERVVTRAAEELFSAETQPAADQSSEGGD